MNRLLAQAVSPFWTTFKACAEALTMEVPTQTKIDAFVSRAIHGTNRSHSGPPWMELAAQSETEPLSSSESQSRKMHKADRIESKPAPHARKQERRPSDHTPEDDSSGLVLSGGGAQAAYEVGVIKALLGGESPATDHKPLNFDVVSGTSAGGVNASLLLSAIADGPAAAASYLEDVWLKDIAHAPGTCHSGAFRFRADPLTVMRPGCFLGDPVTQLSSFARDSLLLAQDTIDRGAAFLLSDEHIGQRLIELVDFSAMVSVEPLELVLSKRIDLGAIRSSSQILLIPCTDWRAGSVRIFDNSSMQDDIGLKVILASSAIPGIFRPVEIEGKTYVDGGVVMNTPLKPAVDSGADLLHVVFAESAMSHMPLPKVPNTANAVSRALQMALSMMFKQDIDLAARVNHEVAAASKAGIPSPRGHRHITIHRYSPSKALDVGWLSFGLDGLRRLIDLGFTDAVEHDCTRNRCVLPAHPAS